MASLVRTFHQIVKEGKGLSHNGPVLFGRVVIHTIKVIHLVQIRPALQNGCDSLLEQIETLTGGNGEHDADVIFFRILIGRDEGTAELFQRPQNRLR